MELLSAARYGNVVSNLAVTKLGTAPAMPTKQEIDVLLKKNRLNFKRGIEHEFNHIEEHS